MTKAVNDMFTGIAHRYDTANSVLSLGVHHLWRAKVVRLSGVIPGNCVLDCATGTGDLAIKFKKKVGDKGLVIGTDFNARMIELAQEKVRRSSTKIDFSV